MIYTNPVETARSMLLKTQLQPFAPLFRDLDVLDFGASEGLSALVLRELGAGYVHGVEPDGDRVAHAQVGEGVHIEHVPDTRKLPFADGTFGFILCNAVLEHIPQPRAAYVREMWRVLRTGGYLLVNETPNKYLPADFHTLHLPFTNWLPSVVAHWIGVKTGRFRADRQDWAYSGWRGLGYFELTHAIPGRFLLKQEETRVRHRVMRAIGLPTALLDPYPVYLLRKQ